MKETQKIPSLRISHVIGAYFIFEDTRSSKYSYDAQKF